MRDTPRAFVCGWPVRHSRSPLIHRHWLRTYGIDGRYEPAEVEPDRFAAFVQSVRLGEWRGGNVTIPHKEAAYGLADRSDEAADIIGAVNTLWMEDGRLVGSNTDWTGFSANLDDYAPEWRQRQIAVVLGAGGAARGILHALIEAGYRDIRIANRTEARARDLADRFGRSCTAHAWTATGEIFAGADLVVNTTSLGMEGDDTQPPDLSAAKDSAIITDAVYVPLMTPFLRSARDRGLKTVDGLGMLLHQAAPGFQKWFHVQPEITVELRSLVIADMERGH